jgi:hypothetical protein
VTAALTSLPPEATLVGLLVLTVAAQALLIPLLPRASRA